MQEQLPRTNLKKEDEVMKKLILAVCFVSLLGGVALADDKDDILALINEYSRL